jgi:hypothetical protein
MPAIPSLSCRSLPLWAVSLLFMVAAVAVCGTYTVVSPIQSAPRTVSPHEVYNRLRAVRPDWHYIGTSKYEDIRSGVWICDKETSFECLNRLNVFNEHFDEWKGVACCRCRFNDPIKESDNYFRMGSLEFLGDEKIIKEVKAIVARKD